MSNKVNAFQVGGDTYGIIPDLTFDNYPTIGSSNPVTSNGIAEAIQGATVGTDISVGREEGTPIGYCSIAYGDHVTSTADYSIVFGKNNKSMTPYSIICGIGNISYGGHTNIVMGNQSSVNGYYSSIMGNLSSIGSELVSTDSDMFYPETYIGYLNLTTKKLYYDPEMTDEQSIDFSPTYNYGTTYIVDLTDNGVQSPGTIYEYKRTLNGNVSRTSVEHVINRYAFFTDISRNSLYYYMGTCYFDAGNDKNYRHYSSNPGEEAGGTYSDEITDTPSNPIYPGSIYFDLISNNFVFYCKRIGMNPYPSSHPDWIKIKVYRCAELTNNYSGELASRALFASQRHGRFAYVYTDLETDSTKVGKVYSSSTYSDETEITNQLFDGEMVVDLSNTDEGGMIYKYRFNVDHVLVYVARCFESTPDCGWPFDGSVGSTVSGSSCHARGGLSYGATVSGYNNTLNYGGSGATIFGLNNSMSVGNTDGNVGYRKHNGEQLGSIIVGKGNTINTRSIEMHTACVFGEENSINVDHTGSDHLFITGWHNQLTGGLMGNGCHIDGTYNHCHSITDTSVSGRSNEVFYIKESNIVGSFNNAGNYIYRYYDQSQGRSYLRSMEFVNITVDKSGIYQGSGVSYDATNNQYTFDTNKIYRIYGIRETFDRYRDNTTSDCLIATKYSLDGHTLIDAQSINAGDYHVYICGEYNTYINRLEGLGAGFTNNDNVIIGSNNKMYAWGNQGITLIGRGLLYFKDGPSSSSSTSSGDSTATIGTVIVGAYNAIASSVSGESNPDADYCFNKSQFVVGIGTADNARKNGFIVSNTGVAACPSTPDNVNEAQSLCNWNPNKMVVTLGMLRDYAPKTPGAVGKPAVTTVTLAANGWTGSTQTVQVTGVTAGAVVIVQPSGDPYTYNFNSIYLSAQADDELTFTCATLPSVDIQVKVVYWT